MIGGPQQMYGDFQTFFLEYPMMERPPLVQILSPQGEVIVPLRIQHRPGTVDVHLHPGTCNLGVLNVWFYA